jgi:hypothetical protein
MVACLLLAAVLVGAFLYLTNPQRLSRIAAGVLTKLTGAQVRIASAHLALDGSIQLRDVRLSVPRMPGSDPQASGCLFEVEQAQIEHRLTALLTGRFEVKSVVLSNPRLYLTEETDSGRYTYQRLPTSESAPGEITKLPELFVRQGHIQFGEVGPEGYVAKGVVNVDGKLTEYPGEPGQYFFALRQEAQGGGSTTLNGRFNPRQFTVAAELERFSFESPYGHLLPRRFRSWWDRLAPAGSLPTFRIAYDPDPKIGLRAVIEMRDVELSLPYVQPTQDAGNEAGAASPPTTATPRPAPRMTQVSGRFTLDNDVVTVEGLSGRIEGIGYHIDGRIDGLDPDAPFAFAMRTDPFVVPEDPPYLYILPPAAQQQFRRLSPSGRFIADVKLVRRKGAGHIAYEGILTLDGAHLTYWRVPYRLSDLHGNIHFNDQTLTIDHIRGVGPSGAEIQIHGETSTPGEGAAVHLVIRVAGMPVDDYFLRALEDRPRGVVEMLMDRSQYRRLLEEGLIRGPDGVAADAILAAAAAPGGAAAPVLSMGGRMNLVVQVDREFGYDKEYRNTVRLDVAGLTGVFKYWSYPLRAVSGWVTVTDDRVLVENVVVQGLSGGRGVVSGSVTKVLEPTPRWQPDLWIKEAALPLDDFLLASIPRPQDHWVRQLQLTGGLQAQAHIFEPPDAPGAVDFRITADVRDGRAQPFGGGFVLDQVAGRTIISQKAVELREFTGRRGPATLQLDGQVQWSDAGPSVELGLRGRGVMIEPALLGLLPPWLQGRARMVGAFAEYRPAGQLDFDLHAAAHDGTMGSLKLDLQPRELAFDLRGQRINLSAIQGHLVFNGDTVEFQKVQTQFGNAGGQATLEGLVTLGAGGGMALQFEARAQRLDDVTRAMIPEAALRAIDGLELRGGYHLQGGRYLQRGGLTAADDVAAGKDTAGGNGQLRAAGSSDFEGRITLRNATAAVGVPITDLDGDLYVRTTQTSGAVWPTMNVRLDAASLRAADRLIAPLAVELASDPAQPQMLHLDRLRGVCYGGALVGEGEIHLAQRGRYRLALTLHEAALDAILEPLKVADPDAGDTARRVFARKPSGPRDAAVDQGPPVPLRVPLDPRANREGGLLSARLDLEAIPGVEASRRGRGAIDVRNASLYQLPLALAVLQIANLSWPVAESFDRAAARFLIDGDLIRLDQIRFESPNVEIVGDGTMRFATRQLNLEMFSRNPAAWNLGAVTDLINVFKDEVVRIEVEGSLDAPRPKVASFSGISRTVGQIFGDRTQRLQPDRNDAIVGGSDEVGPVDPLSSP